MTAPSLLDELEGVVLLAEKATPERWSVGPYGGIYKTDAGGKLCSALLVGESKSGFYENRRANEAAASSAVNFLRTHHAEIAKALMDARRYRWLLENAESVEGKTDWYWWADDAEVTPLTERIDAHLNNSAREDGE